MAGLLLVLGLAVRLARAEEPPLVIVGPATTDSVVLWVQTDRPGQVELRYHQHPLAGSVARAIGRTKPESHLIERLHLTGLVPGARYCGTLWLEGSLVPVTFQTVPREPRDITIAFGSCVYVNDPAIPKGENGGEYEIFDRIVEDAPDLMLWLGDNVYYRPGDWDSAEAMRARTRKDRLRLPNLWPLFASVQNYAIWDDHDFGPNNADASFPHKEAALEVFHEVWPGGTCGQDQIPGAFYRFSWADVDFFMLDDRYYRSSDAMYGPAQMAWLKEQLKSSKAPFKLVVGGCQMLNPVAPYEAWATTPRERQEFLEFIARERIEGLVFLSGDRHCAELICLRPKGGYPLYEFTSSPLTSSLHQMTPEEKENPARVNGSWFSERRNYGLARVSGPTGHRLLTLECKDSQGQLVWTLQLKEQQLRFSP